MYSVTSSLDVSYRDGVCNLYIGGESYLFNRALGLRAGGNFRELCLGFGYVNNSLRKLGLEIDYSFRMPLEIQGSYGSHRIGMTLKFK